VSLIDKVSQGKNVQWSPVFSAFSEQLEAGVFLFTGGYFGEANASYVLFTLWKVRNECKIIIAVVEYKLSVKRSELCSST